MAARDSLFPFAELRALSELSKDDAVSQRDFDAICDAFGSLVEVAEAAHRANYDDPCAFCPPDADCANTRLNDALRRFDFSE